MSGRWCISIRYVYLKRTCTSTQGFNSEIKYVKRSKSRWIKIFLEINILTTNIFDHFGWIRNTTTRWKKRGFLTFETAELTKLLEHIIFTSEGKVSNLILPRMNYINPVFFPLPRIADSGCVPKVLSVCSRSVPLDCSWHILACFFKYFLRSPFKNPHFSTFLKKTFVFPPHNIFPHQPFYHG